MPPIVLSPIGAIRTPFASLEECPRQVGPDAENCRIQLLPQYAEALLHIGSASHVWLLYWLDQADRSRLTVPTPHDGVARGVFANRSPARPNPIALRAVRLHGIEDGTVPGLIVGGMDCLDGTPLLDIKPYVPPVDRIANAWLDWCYP
jgi:tRNA-Thr(GGU) m(6)t(6)A37 methyltransferase TsaA